MAEDIKKEEPIEEQTEAKAAEAPKKERKSKKAAEIEALKAELEALNDLLLRTAAEFDNYKKRTEREKITTAEYAKAQVMKNLLPIIDNADRAAGFEHGTEQFNKGIELIVKQLGDLAGKPGLQEIGAVGDTFDPTIHETVMHVEDENFGENTVSQILQKGYKFGDTVVRPAMVQVAN